MVLIENSSFIYDDNINDINNVEKYVRNSNVGTTFYLPNKYYNKKMEDEFYFFRKNGIYLNNLFLSINNDNCNEIIFNENTHKILSNEKILYPQYFIKSIRIGNNPEINYNEIGKSDSLFDLYLNSFKLNDNFKIKYLKYKNKYLRLKSKIN